MSEKIIKKTVSVILEFIICLGLVLFIAIGWNIGFDKFYADKYYLNTDVEIINMSGIDTDGTEWKTTNEDPWIIVKHNPQTFLTLDIDIYENDLQQGVIYYSDSIENFSEDRAISYSYLSGENVIKIDDDNALYLRLDITNNSDVEFSINAIKEESELAYLVNNLNFVVYLGASILLLLLFEFIKVAQVYNKKVELCFLGIIVISLVAIFGKYLIGNTYYIFTDIGTDTFYQYYPYYVNQVLNIREGTFSSWNWDYGLGTSILNMTTWTFDPFAMIMVFLGVVFGPSTIQYLLVWMQIIKIIIIYIFTKKFLRCYLQDEFSICLSAYICSFNGYLFLWGQHYFLGTACVFAIFIIYAIENYIQNKCVKGGVWISLAVACTLMYSYYTGYMILVVAAVYFLFRYFTVIGIDNVGNLVKRFAHCLVSVLSGVCLSAIIFIPACYYITTNSSRLEGATDNILVRIWESFSSSLSLAEIGMRFSRLISNNILFSSNGDNSYYEMPQFFCTIFIFFFIGQWIVYETRNAKCSKRWLHLIVKMLLLYPLLFNSVSGLILNGFAYVAYRYTFVIFPFLALCIGIVWQEVICKNKISFWGIEIGTLLTVYALLYSYKNCVDELKNYIIIITVMIILGRWLLMVMYKKERCCVNITSVLVLLLIVTTMLDNVITTNDRSVMSSDGYPLEWESGKLSNDTTKAIDWIKSQDDSFYRIEKTYADWNMVSDSFFENYSTVSWYNSTPNTNLVEFYNNVYYDANTSMQSVKHFKIDTELDITAISLVNTKYILSKYELPNEDWKLLNQIGEVYVYKNKNTDSIAKWFNRYISKEEFELLEENEKANILSNTVVLEDEIVLNNQSEASIEGFELKSQTELAGRVKSTGQGMLMIAVPDQEGWEIYVDDVKVETYNCDYGFLGVLLEEGEYNVNLKYHVPMSGLGKAVSVLGLIMMIGIVLYEKKLNDKDYEVIN